MPNRLHRVAQSEPEKTLRPKVRGPLSPGRTREVFEAELFGPVEYTKLDKELNYKFKQKHHSMKKKIVWCFDVECEVEGPARVRINRREFRMGPSTLRSLAEICAAAAAFLEGGADE